jgi:hypothetical protein
MNGLIGDRFLKRFLKRFRRPSRLGFARKAETPEKAVELTYEVHHRGSVNSTPAATQQPNYPQKQNGTK